MRFTVKAFVAGLVGSLGAMAAVIGVSTVVGHVIGREIRAAAREIGLTVDTNRHSHEFTRSNPEAPNANP